MNIAEIRKAYDRRKDISSEISLLKEEDTLLKEKLVKEIPVDKAKGEVFHYMRRGNVAWGKVATALKDVLPKAKQHLYVDYQEEYRSEDIHQFKLTNGNGKVPSLRK